MVKEQKSAIKRQGGYIRYLRARRNLSAEAFANKLGISPCELQQIEDGNIEAPDRVFRELLSVSNADGYYMYLYFGERWEELKEKGYI